MYFNFNGTLQIAQCAMVFIKKDRSQYGLFWNCVTQSSSKSYDLCFLFQVLLFSFVVVVYFVGFELIRFAPLRIPPPRCSVHLFFCFQPKLGLGFQEQKEAICQTRRIFLLPVCVCVRAVVVSAVHFKCVWTKFNVLTKQKPPC